VKLKFVKVGKFISRLNKFKCVVNINGFETKVHLHDPGRLEELLIPNAEVYLAVNKGIYPYRIIAVKAEDETVLLDSSLHNNIFEEYFNLIFPNRKIIGKEIPLGKRRIDFLLDDNTYVEVKGVTLVHDNVALFPDSPTERGRRQIAELEKVKGSIVFLVLRRRAERFSPNWKKDPKFAIELLKAHRDGLKVIPFKVIIESFETIPIGRIEFSPYLN